MKKDTSFVNQLPVDDFKRGMSFSIVDGKSFTKAGSPQVEYVQPIAQPRATEAQQSLPANVSTPSKPEK